MKDFTRLFIVSNSNGQGNPFFGRSSSNSGFIISVKDDELTVSQKFGCAPTSAEVNTAFGRFIAEYELQHEPIERYQRQLRYRFVFYSGDSGCQDTYIETDLGDGFPKRKKICHMSMCGKVNEGIHCFVYDFLDLCTVGKQLTILGDAYHYDEDGDENREMEAKIITPRIVSQEPGWSSPDNYPTDVFILRDSIVREERKEVTI